MLGRGVKSLAQAPIESMGAAQPSDPSAQADRDLWAPCFRVNVVCTTGAGNATMPDSWPGYYTICHPKIHWRLR